MLRISALTLFFLMSINLLASTPRIDLYQKIKRETGVSLKEALGAAVGRDIFAATHLKIYAKNSGLKAIEGALQEEIKARKAVCEKQKSIICDERVAEVNEQLNDLRKMSMSFNSLPSHQQIYYCLTVYHFQIILHVLKGERADWLKTCSATEKINTRPCQEKMFEANILADIAADISQIAYAKVKKKPPPEALLKSIQDRLLRYEKA